MGWTSFKADDWLDGLGTEGGHIVLDEEYRRTARITLEEGCQTAPFAITCGIYGWMVHTRFLGSDGDARAEFLRMKKALAKIADMIPPKNADASLTPISGAISDFVAQFP